MPDSPGVGINLVIIPAGKALVTEEMDGLVVDAGNLLLGSDMLQTIRLVPASGKNIKGDLAADGETGNVRLGRIARQETYLRP